MLLGDDTLVYLVLALGAALVVGNVLALVRPPTAPKDGELAKAPATRSVAMALIGLAASIWAIASLVSS